MESEAKWAIGTFVGVALSVTVTIVGYNYLVPDNPFPPRPISSERPAVVDCLIASPPPTHRPTP